MNRVLRASFGAFFLMLGIVMAAFYFSATDEDLYFRVQKAEKVEAGVSDEVLYEYDYRMARYLDGDKLALLGAELFNEREIAHMRDVRKIFRVLDSAYVGFAAVGAALFAEGVAHGRWRRTLLFACLYGGALLALLFLALSLRAFFDFEGAFEAMHKALFSNDLWRLDPDTDLMIRMLPERFFARLAGVLALRCMLAALLVPAASLCAALFPARIIRRVRAIFPKKPEDEHDLV